jgi:hypothetical protein
MLGFNFLSMENYAPVEGFTSKKEKFTSDELEALMDVDEDTTTTSDSTTTTTMVDDNEETTTTMVDDNEETTTTMVDDNEETTTTMSGDDEEMNATPTMEDDIDTEELETTSMINNIDNESENVMSETGDENDNGNEGFVGSSIIRRQATRSTLYMILCIGLVYIAIKLMGVYQKKRMNMVYKKVKFLKLNKLNLDTDLVLSVVVGGLVYLIGMRMGWF